MKTTSLLRNSILACAAVACAVGMSQGRPAVKAALKMDKPTAPVGSEVKGAITVTIPDGWHAYQNPPSKDYQIPLSVAAANSATKLVKTTYPEGAEEQVAGELSRVYNGEVKIPVTIKLGSKTGPQTLRIKVTYQLCDAGSCLPPASIVAAARVTATKKGGSSGG